MEPITCPSGAILKIGKVPFPEALALYETVLEEMKDIQVTSQTDVMAIAKDFICVGFSSKKIKPHLWKCLERCTYDNGKGNLKVDKDSFEPVESRQDYPFICKEVMEAVLTPFVKPLLQMFSVILVIFSSYQESKSQATQS